jgi:hypothetical protein
MNSHNRKGVAKQSPKSHAFMMSCLRKQCARFGNKLVAQHRLLHPNPYYIRKSLCSWYGHNTSTNKRSSLKLYQETKQRPHSMDNQNTQFVKHQDEGSMTHVTRVCISEASLAHLTTQLEDPKSVPIQEVQEHQILFCNAEDNLVEPAIDTVIPKSNPVGLARRNAVRRASRQKRHDSRFAKEHSLDSNLLHVPVGCGYPNGPHVNRFSYQFSYLEAQQDLHVPALRRFSFEETPDQPLFDPAELTDMADHPCEQGSEDIHSLSLGKGDLRETCVPQPSDKAYK